MVQPNITNTSFTVAPNVLTELLGSNLTENLSIVFAEQIKNSFDAKATKVTIDLTKFDSDIITISDDGIGTEVDDIMETWFRAGTSVKTNDTKLLGGKGIGRFTLFALGNKIEVSTISNHVESSFTLSTEEINSAGNVNDIHIQVSTNNTKTKQGTTLKITNLIPEYLDSDEINEIKMDLQNLLLDNTNFNLEIKTPKSYRKNISLIKFDEGIKYSTIVSNFNLNWDDKDFILNHRAHIQIGTEKKDLNQDNVHDFDKGYQQIKNYIAEHKTELKQIGNLSLRLFHFYNPNNKLPLYEGSSISSTAIQNKFLSYSSGFNLYRNGFKIFGYGKNDWLELEKSSRNTGKKISNSRSVGQIILDPISANYLVEKTNREGLQTSKKSFKIFKNLIEKFINLINIERLAIISDDLLVKLYEESKTDKPTKDAKTPTAELHTVEKNVTKTNNLKKYNVSNSPTPIDTSAKNIHPKIALKKSKIKNTIFKCNVSYDLMEFVDLKKSFNMEGLPLSENDIIFLRTSDGKVYEKNLLQPQASPKTINIIVEDISGSISNTFTIKIEREFNSKRNDLFQLNNGKHFRLESDDDNDFFKTIMQQLNDLWVQDGQYDYVINAAIRSIADVEISSRLIPINNTSNSELKTEFIGSGFSAATNLINNIRKDQNKSLRKKISQKLGIDKKNIDNFFLKFNNFTAEQDFVSRLRSLHTGAHNPIDFNADKIISLANDIIAFLELCEGYIAVLQEPTD